MKTIYKVLISFLIGVCLIFAGLSIGGLSELGEVGFLSRLNLRWSASEMSHKDFVASYDIDELSIQIHKGTVQLVYSLLILDNSHYNKMVQEGFNQANIKAKLYNQATVNVMQKVKQNVKVKVINQFVSPKTYFNYLKNEVIVVKDLMFESDAEKKYMAIVAAEILSRYAYLQYYANMTKSLKMNLCRGTSTAVDTIAAKIATKYGEKMLMKVAKLNFTNTKRVKALIEDQ